MNEKYLEKLNNVRKYFKKDKLYLELCLINYEGYYIYISLNYIKKFKSYRLSWIDLDVLEDNKVEKYISYEYISGELVNDIDNYLNKIDIMIDNNLNYGNKDLVNLLISSVNLNKIKISFNRYLPKSLESLFDLFVIIFNYLPRRLENLLYELLSELTGNSMKYDYKKEFSFDLLNGNIDEIFANHIILRGKNYFDEGKVIFLEKIDDRYFAVVNGTEKYVIVIKYDEENKIMKVYCSCPCEFYCKHIYAVIIAIRNNNFKRFFKIMYRKKYTNLLERVINFDYILCLGVVEQNLEIINNDGEIELVPILNSDNKLCWEILEDSEDEILSKYINDFVNR